MATTDIVRKFAEDAIKVERVFGKAGIAGNPGRVIFLLDMAQIDGFNYMINMRSVRPTTKAPHK